MKHYYGGAPRRPGTTLPDNVTSDCPHLHRTPGAAQQCIDAMDRAIKAGHGDNTYCDRVVMVCDDETGERFAYDEGAPR